MSITERNKSLLCSKVRALASKFSSLQKFSPNDLAPTSLFLEEAGIYLNDKNLLKKASALRLMAETFLIQIDFNHLSITTHPLSAISILGLRGDWIYPEAVVKKTLKLAKKLPGQSGFEIMRGISGIALAFHSCPEIDAFALKFLRDTIGSIDGRAGHLSHPQMSFSEWTKDANEDPRFNLGLAHGLPGVLCYLSSKKEEDLAGKLAETLLAIGDEAPDENFPSIWPLPEKNSDRFCLQNGWCYGDCSAGFSLLRFAKSFPKHHLAMRAKVMGEVRVLRSLHPQSPKLQAKDPHFCHGTSGMLQIAWRAKELTKNSSYFEHVNQWLEVTYGPDSRIAKEEVHRGSALLDSELGMGFVALTYLKGESSNWDRILGLS